MKDCYVLKKEIKILITKVYFHRFLRKDFDSEQRREKVGQFMRAQPKINVILGGTYVGGDSNTGKMKYGKQVLMTACL